MYKNDYHEQNISDRRAEGIFVYIMDSQSTHQYTFTQNNIKGEWKITVNFTFLLKSLNQCNFLFVIQK